MISRRTGASFSGSRQVTIYRRTGRDLEVLSTWALQLCTTSPAPDRAVSGSSISCSASKRSAAILSSSTELPVIEPSSPSSARRARGTSVPRACFEIYVDLLFPLIGAAHNSSPSEGVEAAKYRNLPEVVNSPGSEPTAPRCRSLSRAVFALEPSLPHISLPCTPSSALKSSTPLNAVNVLGSESAGPGLMFSTSLVPLSVPLLFHSSRPFLPSLAAKKRVLRIAIRLEISESLDAVLGLMSLTRIVPFLVPSLFHSSTPCLPSFAV